MLKKLKFAGKLAAVLLLVVLLLAAGCFGVWKYLGKGWFDDRALLRENPVAESGSTLRAAWSASWST